MAGVLGAEGVEVTVNGGGVHEAVDDQFSAGY